MTGGRKLFVPAMAPLTPKATPRPPAMPRRHPESRHLLKGADHVPPVVLQVAVGGQLQAAVNDGAVLKVMPHHVLRGSRQSRRGLLGRPCGAM
jgi:hypothetical protein